ncbi:MULTISPECIES: trypsin-like peptidase domain-containing protein [unclassified Microcoleus]|uniref:S1C family serine protease n=1 Tax=unclassified Microcoleus TaxID=2642155 RepID=UPI002FD242DA
MTRENFTLANGRTAAIATAGAARPPIGKEISGELALLGEQLRHSSVRVQTRHSGAGSGVIWDSDGSIVTNAHVAQSEKNTVELWDGRVFEAVRTAIDRDRDLALLKIAARDLPAAAIGNSDNLRVGELVLAIGNPLGIPGALTTGIIHSANHTAPLLGRHQRGSIFGKNWLIADIKLAPGNSGGLLANARGEVVGINTAIANGLGLAVPAREVERFLRASATEPVRLGATMRSVPVLWGNRQILGLLVLDVAFGSLAMAARLQPGDVLISVLGQFLGSPDDLARILWNAKPGDRLSVEFVRSGKLFYSEAVAGESRGFFR